MNPLAGENQLLEAKSLTFLNSVGFEFLVKINFFPPMEMKKNVLEATSS